MKKVKLEDVCKMTSGGTPKRSNLIFYNGAIPWAKIGDLEVTSDGIVHSTEETITKEGLRSINNRIFEPGTLFLAMYGSVGKTAFTGKLMSCNQAILGLTAKEPERIDLRYLKRWFEFSKDALIHGARGVALKNISATIVKNLKIPLPPLPVQKRIAEILDLADAYRQKTKALIDKYDELAQSIFLEMFGDPVTNPKGWERKAISETGNVVTGNTPPRNDLENYEEKYIEWIKTDNIESDHYYVTPSKEYLSKKGLAIGRSVSKGSLLIVCIAGSINSIGRAALTNRCVSFNQQINAIEVNPDTNSWFLYFLFRSIPHYIQNHASLGMKRMLSKGDLSKIKVISPPISVQTEFEKKVLEIIRMKEQMIEVAGASENLFNSLLQKAFKGELVNEDALNSIKEKASHA